MLDNEIYINYVVSQSVALIRRLALYGNLLEMEILEAHTKPCETNSQRLGPIRRTLGSPPGNCDAH